MHAWPLLDLQVRTPRLTLRVPDDEDLEQLGDVAAAGVHGLGDGRGIDAGLGIGD